MFANPGGQLRRELRLENKRRNTFVLRKNPHKIFMKR